MVVGSRRDWSCISPSLPLLFFSIFTAFSLSTAAAPPWPMYGGNPEHTGLYSIEGKNNIDNFTLREIILTNMTYVYPQATIIDIIGNQEKEIIISSDPSSLNCLSSNGEIVWKREFPKSIPTTATVTDLEGSGIYTILVGCMDGKLYAITPEGQQKWVFDSNDVALSIGGGIYSNPMVDDIDADGANEIIFGAPNDNIICLDSKGLLKWSFPVQKESYPLGITCTPTLSDLDNDGLKEIIIGSDYKYLYVLHLTNNSGIPPHLLWTFETTSESLAILSAPVVHDIDNDDVPEILFGTRDNEFYCLNADGTIDWSFTTEGPNYISCSIGDINNDGDQEVIFGSYDKSIYLLDNNGTLIKRISTYDRVTSQVILCDLNGDMSLELIVPTIMIADTPAISILDNNGSILASLSYGEHGNLSHRRGMNFVACDLLNDGFIEIIGGTQDGRLLIFYDETLNSFFNENNNSKPNKDVISWIFDSNRIYYLILIIFIIGCCSIAYYFKLKNKYSLRDRL